MKFALAFALLLIPTLAHADVKLPAIFSDHMVVQADKPVTVWGWADPGEKVTVSLAGQSPSATADADGKWSVQLAPLRATAEPQTLRVSGKNELTVGDVLVGEVWLGSGQSNMAMQIRGLHGEVDRADEEIAAAKFPQIRLFVHDDPFDIYALACPPAEPLADRAGRWVVCSPETVAHFSALGYFFARDLYRELHVPVGILSAAVGGTPIEAWTSIEPQCAVPELAPLLADYQKRLTDYDPKRALQEFELAKKAWLKERAAARAAGKPDPKAPARFRNLEVLAPGRLYNGVIAPLVPYTIRGVLWYQGERNAAGPFTGLYGLQLRTLINDWRARWHEPLYFAWVQLPGFGKEQKFPSEPTGWGVAVRDGQRQCLSLPNTAMAITLDLGDPAVGHPANKVDFAARLSRLALHDVYKKPIEFVSGPVFSAFERRGSDMILTFDYATGLRAAGLHAPAGDLRGFALAGADQKFVWATARIADDRVIVSSPDIPNPIAVRYAWAANPIGNLVNAAGLPASPFRTDKW